MIFSVKQINLDVFISLKCLKKYPVFRYGTLIKSLGNFAVVADSFLKSTFSPIMARIEFSWVIHPSFKGTYKDHERSLVSQKSGSFCS